MLSISAIKFRKIVELEGGNIVLWLCLVYWDYLSSIFFVMHKKSLLFLSIL